MLFALPFWLWAIWVISFILTSSSKGVGGAASIVLGFLAYLVVRSVTPQLGPWEQYGIYLVVGVLVALTGSASSWSWK